MNNPDAIQMMKRCRDEIVRLRRVIAELNPRAEAYDTLRQVLDMVPSRSGESVCGEDLAYKLEREIRKLEREMAAEDEKAARLRAMQAELDRQAAEE